MVGLLADLIRQPRGNSWESDNQRDTQQEKPDKRPGCAVNLTDAHVWNDGLEREQRISEWRSDRAKGNVDEEQKPEPNWIKLQRRDDRLVDRDRQ